MIKKIVFILLIFIFTTGFFKSKLEKCADYKFDKVKNHFIFPTAEYKDVKRSKHEIEKIKKDREKRKKKSIANFKTLPICKDDQLFTLDVLNFMTCRNSKFSIKDYSDALDRIDKARNIEIKTIKVRDIPKEETDILKKKFLNKNLKKKLNLADTKNPETNASSNYNYKYKECIAEKKNNPEIFKAKY